MKLPFLSILICCISLFLCHQPATGQGIPYFRNYTASEYAAHNQNFDIASTDDGIVFVANFEGLLYYDNASWSIIHTPGITRVTSLLHDSRGTLWAGGYNFIGRVQPDERGIFRLHALGPAIHGEVTRIWEADSTVYIQLSDGHRYTFSDNTLTPMATPGEAEAGRAGAVPDHILAAVELTAAYVTHAVELDGMSYALATNGEGVIFTDRQGREICRITEDNGLCSNNVFRLAYNGHGLLWGATDNGIFAIAAPSIYTHFSASEGLHGEVMSLATLGSDIYVGTSGGLFRFTGKQFTAVKEVALACWQLVPQGNRLLAATADGVYGIGSGRDVTVLTTDNTLSLITDNDDFLSGEMDGVYRNSYDGRQRQKVWNVEKVVGMVRDAEGTLWLQNLYGGIWKAARGAAATALTPADGSEDEIRTLVSYQGHVTAVAVGQKKPFPFPLFSYADDYGLLWLTDDKGKRLYALRDTVSDEPMSRSVYPLMDYSVRAMMRRGEQLWMGGDKGVNIVDNSYTDPTFAVMPRLMLRSVLLFGDSVVWGGQGEQPDELPALQSNENHLLFKYSIDFPSLLLATQYRTRLNGGTWSAWETNTFEEYSNLTSGSFRFEVQARDAYGRLTDIVGMNFTITPPLYLRWYMIVVYILLLAALVYGLALYRLYQLERDKHRLEAVVKERTQDLVEAQHELVRQEKMATVGKLTQGLIDRILNPLNYINNFAKLSESLVGDAKANIEDEKDRMTPDNYDDTMEVLDMLRGNLQKVGEHGANTSRILKSMEEMLKDRTGGQTDMSLTALLQRNGEMLKRYYEKEIAEYHIVTALTLPAAEVRIHGNAELLSSTIMSLLRNAIYAVMKKVQRGAPDDYQPEVRLGLETRDGKALVTVHDNGTGIEETILDRIFDPFFTTKTTGEASGVGLYISREVAQNHGGDITVRSVKREFTEFSITLPLNPKTPNNPS